ncbi:MAG: hypothetical protein WAU21_14965, partial [Chitinophagales bacterium]
DSTGDSAKIITECNAGYVCDFTDAHAMKNALIDMYQKFRNNTLQVNSKNIEQYTRKGGAKKFAEIMHGLVSL